MGDLVVVILGFTTLFVASIQTLLLWPASREDRLAPASNEKTFKAYKAARLGAYGVLAASQAALLITAAIVHGPRFNLVNAAGLAVAVAYLAALVLLSALWPRQMALQLTKLELATVVEAGLLLALDVAEAQSKTVPAASAAADVLDQEYLARFAIHSVQLLVAVVLLISNVIIQQHMLLQRSERGEFQPLLDADVERDAAKKGWQPGDGRMALAAQAFSYVWPNTGRLRIRLAFCFLLVAIERCVNIAVPVVYKHMVEQLAGFSRQGSSPDANSTIVPAARALLARCAAALDGADGLLSAAAAAALLKDTVSAFWAAFHPWTLLYLIMFWLRGGSGAEGLLANVRDLLWIPITQAAFRRVATDVFGHLLALDLNFHVHRKTGQIMRILDRGTSSIQATVEVVLFNVLPQMVDIVIACTYLATMMQPWVAAIVLVTVSSYVPLTVIITERRMVVRKRMNALDNERESRATDMLLNYETVKYFTNEDFELQGYDKATRQYQAAEYWQMAFLALLSIVQSTIVWVGLAAGMVLCVLGVAQGRLSVGDAVLFVTMMTQLYLPLTYFSSYYRQVQKALIDMENMFELLATRPLVKDLPNAKALVVREGRVEFKDVKFGYPATLGKKDRAAMAAGIHVPPPKPLSNVLHGVSFGVAGGQTLAIVGSTGSGKSTILRLLLRFYDPTSGAVMIDGQDIKYCTQPSVRRAIAVVPQDTVLFNDTIGYNIRYGRTSALDAQVHQAARVAHIHDHLMAFPKGYSTKVGERGLRLSGGEKQRVAFARAVLKDPAILVLDEATSALDSLTERMIQSSLAQMRSHCTSVIVAHRLSTVMDADCIVVLQEGLVAECGSHGQLLEHGGLYAEMWARQLSDGSNLVSVSSNHGHNGDGDHNGGSSRRSESPGRSHDSPSRRRESPMPPLRTVRKADSTNDLKGRGYPRLRTADSEITTPALSPDQSVTYEDSPETGTMTSGSTAGGSTAGAGGGLSGSGRVHEHRGELQQQEEAMPFEGGEGSGGTGRVIRPDKVEEPEDVPGGDETEQLPGAACSGSAGAAGASGSVAHDGA